MGCFLPKNLYGIIGWPLGQTLSPLIQNTGFQALGLPGVYLAWPLPPESLGNFMESLRLFNIRGLSVTIPHKMGVMAFLDNFSESAALAGAVNTLFWKENDLCGDNTDVAGFMEPLQQLQLEGMSALLLGAGGAARAAATGLRLSGCRQVRVTSPGNKHQYELAERFAFNAIPWQERHAHPADLVINATPMGMYGKLVNETPFDFKLTPPVENGWAYDLVYNPAMTKFLWQAQNCGRKIISGVEMFFGQGNAQFQLWTGKNLPLAAKTALDQALHTTAI